VTAPEGRYASALQLAEKQTTAIRAQVSAQTEPTAQRSPQTARMSPRGEQPEKSTPRPVELGLRVGLALPMGYYVGDQQLSDSIKRAIPVEFDVGTRATPAVYVGAYIQLGYGEAGDRLACSLNSTSDSCDDVTLLRTGLEVHYRWLLTKNSYLWTGTGTGFEMLSASQPRENLHTYGWDIAHLDVGLDYWTSDSVAIGPYASWSIAEYMKMKSSPASGDSTTVDVGNPTTHQWIMFGLRFVWVKTAS
jgi:hypothetical protein